ncbi:cytidine deaminase [Wenzhouxiangella sediminis]|uniref:Cytidine deaminase n=1 Tax=Wenzhouxiangella sediminis TaxID=1792836 RepID=A0A3E1KBX2_9GAMM|nr:cytidine deaminase [Wenzhouxiangella sediminis]RFF31555.1 cytidine deaminase [Wenzhouxiangella sediminis]
MKNIDEDLLAELKRLRGNAYAPYSDHPVAAVVESGTGRHFGGANVEVAHFKSTCAEASAISAMANAGDRDIRLVYVLGPGGRPCPPCGDCRQRIREFASPETWVALIDDEGRVQKTYTIGELLPDSFGPDHIPG